MRNVVWQMMISLDGRMEGPKGELDWHVIDDDFTRYVAELGETIDTILFGRVTYEMMASYWPTSTEPEAKMMNDLPKIVFSRTVKKFDWNNSRLARPDVAAEIADLKSRPGKDIALFGSADFAKTLLELRLVDEVRLFIAPLVLGRGNPTFKTLERLSLRLIRSETSKAGNLMVRYQPLYPTT